MKEKDKKRRTGHPSFVYVFSLFFTSFPFMINLFLDEFK